VPLRTGPVAVANFGVVVTFKPPVVCVEEEDVPELPVVAVAVAVVVLELALEELPEEPHPDSARRARQTVSVRERLLICARTLA
jgi:hypothetical protein